MRRMLILLPLFAAFAGCQAPPVKSVMDARPARAGRDCRSVQPIARRPAANLLLARSEDLRLAADLNSRSDWPSVDLGYRVEDASYLDFFALDDQSFFDGDGSYIHQAQSARTSVLLR